MKENEILRIHGEDYKEMTKCLLKEADLAGEIGDSSKRIGIKPNLVSPTPAFLGATTHPEVTAGIIEYLQEHGFHNLLMLESSWVGDKTDDALDVCGYNELIEKYGVPFLDIQKDSHHPADCAGMTLEICDGIDKVDFLINVPVLKGHCQTKITCALKNIKGLVPSKEKRHFHAMGLHAPIAHLNAAVHQDFIVVDHICGDLDFEDGGNPVVRNCVMAAKDPVLVDAYVCRLLHYTPDDVPYIRLAEQLGVGSADLSQLVLRSVRRVNPGMSGESDPDHCEHQREAAGTVVIDCDEEEELPRSDKAVSVMYAVQEVDSCSACYGTLIPALDRIREEGNFEALMEALPEPVCIGQGYKGKTGKVGVGNCTRLFDFCVKGCPPEEDDIYNALMSYMMSHK